MSARKLGGGRVLGSGRSLSPALPPRNSSLLSPSTSSVSIDSSTSQPSSDAQDLSSRISLDTSDDSTAAAAAAAQAKLVCPICDEVMVEGTSKSRKGIKLMDTGYSAPAEQASRRYPQGRRGGEAR